MSDSEQVLQVTVKVAELGANVILRLIPEILRILREGVRLAGQVAKTTIDIGSDVAQKIKEMPGEKSMHHMAGKDTEIASVTLDGDIKEIKSELAKHGVDFHIMKNGEGEYKLFFEAKNAAMIENALERVMLKKEMNKDRPDKDQGNPEKTGKTMNDRMADAAKKAEKARTTKRDAPKRPVKTQTKGPSKGTGSSSKAPTPSK